MRREVPKKVKLANVVYSDANACDDDSLDLNKFNWNWFKRT